MTMKPILIAAMLAGTMLSPQVRSESAVFAEIETGPAQWKPISSERLVRLPTQYLDKAVEQDFRSSSLSGSLSAVNEQLVSKADSLKAVKDSMADAEGELLIELRHQYLEEKSEYLDLIERQHRLRRSELETKLGLYERVLDDLKKDRQRANDPVSGDLIQAQREARERLKKSLSKVDHALFEAGAGESKYGKRYAANAAKIEQLRQAIANHVVNDVPMIDGKEINRESYLRDLVQTMRSGLALLDQEREMTGYMARLVALDAQALEQELTYGLIFDGADQSGDSPIHARNAADFFINN